MALHKIIDLGYEVPETGEPRVQILNPSLVKTASTEIQDFWDKLEDDPGHSYLWVIGVSAREFYGCNNNGDAFDEQDLKDTHRDFVSNANVFLQHVNKDPAKGIGKPVFSWYNDAMHRIELVLKIDKSKPNSAETIRKIQAGEQLYVSMGCFPAGTPILMGDGSEKNIEDIMPGDFVITHTGKSREVTSRMSLPYTGNIYAFSYSGHTEKLVATDEHPILVRRYGELPSQTEGDCPVCGLHVRYLTTHIVRKKDDAHTKYWSAVYQNSRKYTEVWVDAKNVKVGDYVVTPLRKDVTSDDAAIPTEKDLAFAGLLGYFVSEGSYVKYKGKPIAIQLNFHEKETDFHQEVLGYLGILSEKKATYQIRHHKHLAVISLYDKELAQKIFDMVGEYSNRVHLSNEMLSWSRAEKLEFLGKYIDGDGTYSAIHNNLSFATISRRLAIGLEHLFASIGIRVRMSTTPTSKSNNRTYTGDLSQSDSILLTTSAKAKRVLPFDSKKNSYCSPPGVFIDNDAIVRKVTCIEVSKAINLPVYNLSVDTDESFIAENIAVHNCSVAFDQCSICGNKAPTRRDYCDHLRYNMKKILPDGRQVYALNPNPKFFDISIVAKPADPTAFALDKKASDGGTADTAVSISSAQLGEIADDLSMKVAALKKVSDIIKRVDGNVVDVKDGDNKDANAQVDAAKTIAEGFERFKYPEMPYEEMSEHNVSPAAFLGAMHGMGAPITLGDAAWLSGCHAFGRCPTMHERHEMFEALPHALETLMDKPNIIDSLLRSICSGYNGEFDDAGRKEVIIRVMRPVAEMRISMIRGMAPDGMLEKIGTAFGRSEMESGVDFGRTTGEIIKSTFNSRKANFSTIKMRDKFGREVTTTPYHLRQAFYQTQLPGKILRPAAAAALGLGAIACAVTEPSMTGKLLGSLALGAPALALARSGDTYNYGVVTSEGMPVSDSMARAVFKQHEKTGSAKMPGLGTVAGMAIPAALALDYAWNKWRHSTPGNPYPYKPDTVLGQVGEAVADNPMTGIAAGGVVGSMLQNGIARALSKSKHLSPLGAAVKATRAASKIGG